VSEAETTTVIGYVEKGGPAYNVGLRPGDRIVEVDGRPVTKFGGMGDSVTWRIVRSEGHTVSVKVLRDGKEMVFNPEVVKDTTKFWQRKSLRQIKIGPALSSLVAEVVPNSPAASAGLLAGDRVVSVDGKKLYQPGELGDYIEENPNSKLTLNVERHGKAFEVSLIPQKPISPPDEKPRLGIKWDGNGKTTLAHPGAIEQVNSSVAAMLETFGALFARHSDIKAQHLGGAVKIMDVYYRLFNSEQGWRLAIWFSVLMNVNLALLNMLPIPVSDGGHILLAILEGIRRKPISLKILSTIQTACAVLLIAFMVYIAFYDVQDLPWRRTKEKPTEIKFAPKAAEHP
jgi:regulator of sigma E protease